MDADKSVYTDVGNLRKVRAPAGAVRADRRSGPVTGPGRPLKLSTKDVTDVKLKNTRKEEVSIFNGI
jgi:hypothetical protein